MIYDISDSRITQYSSPKPICGGIPGYLIYPNDPLSQIMFGSQMQKVRDKRCGYQFMLYTDIADPTPEIRQQTPSFDINETHIFWNPDSSAFCAVSTMKAPSVKTSDLRNWVEMNDQMGMLFGDMKPFLNLPSGLANGEYRRVELHDMGRAPPTTSSTASRKPMYGAMFSILVIPYTKNSSSAPSGILPPGRQNAPFPPIRKHCSPRMRCPRDRFSAPSFRQNSQCFPNRTAKQSAEVHSI